MRIIDDTPITYMDWLTYVANRESVIFHVDSVLKDSQQASEGEDMDYEDLISTIDTWDTDSYKSEDFLLNPICILYIIECLYKLFYVQSIQIKYI